MPFHVYLQVHTCHFTLKNSNENEILEVVKDRKLVFHQHIKKVCGKAGQKLSVLLRHSPYLDTNTRKTVHIFLLKSQLSYCPLV